MEGAVVIIIVLILYALLSEKARESKMKCENCGSVWKRKDLENGKCPLCGSSAVKSV
jgi:Zn finger protein HypA/HybF involved in hydrogenase expression